MDDEYKFWIGLILTALIVVAGVGYLISTLSNDESERTRAPLTLQDGDRVQINYTALLVDGRVFETTYESVGKNESIPKTARFDPDRVYEPLEVTFGKNSKLPPGLEAILRGATEGPFAYQEVIVPSDRGFGAPDPSKVLKVPLEETVPIYEVYTRDEFNASYHDQFEGGVPCVLVTVNHSKWGWPATVVSVTEDNVTIMNCPVLGQIVHPYTWDTEVVRVDRSPNGGKGVIGVRHRPVLHTIGDDEDRVVSRIDLSGGYVYLDGNDEKLGTTLIYKDIEIVDISKGD